MRQGENMERTADAEIDFSAGYAPKIETEEPFMPRDLWSEILPGLWVGGTDDADTTQGVTKGWIKPKPITKKDFHTVITLFAWSNPVSWEVRELRFGFYDAPTMLGIDMETVSGLVDAAHADWLRGRRVLVRCQAGLNRSGLVTALILMKEGYKAREAIDLLRDKRSEWVLFNRTFEAYLLSLDKVKN